MSPTVRTGDITTLVSGLVDRLAARLAQEGAPSRLVVGLTGAPGSGKSTLAGSLCTALAGRRALAGFMPMDGFHMSNAVLDELGRRGRKGAPDTFDVEGYLALLDRVRAGGEVLSPVYRRDLHEPVAASTRVTGPGVVVTEGNYLALDTHGWRGARERIDALIMIDVADDELIRRLIDRHTAFGRQRGEAAHWVRMVDMPNARLVAATAARCDELWRVG